MPLYAMTTNHVRRQGPKPLRGYLGAALLTLALIAAMVGTPVGVAAQPPSELPAEPALVVALQADGAARVTLVVPFDLATQADQEAFDAFRANATAREARLERFTKRMRAIADRAETNTGREMQIRNPAMAFVDRGETGLVTVSVTWDGLAARTGDGLVLREPFASGVSLERSVYVIGPDGYRVATVSPTPTERSETEARWAAGASLDGFEATFVPAPTETSTEAYGFGIGLAVLSLFVGTAAILYRVRDRA